MIRNIYINKEKSNEFRATVRMRYYDIQFVGNDLNELIGRCVLNLKKYGDTVGEIIIN